jgi:DHA1 family tetracycline resistance protein-like MFS transporter
MALIARFLAGAGNGNIAVARAYIGDISQPSDISRRMGMIGAAFGLGFMIGPFIGGLLSDPATSIGGIFDTTFWSKYPYLLPCIFSSILSLISLLLAIIWLPESLPKKSRKNQLESPVKEIRSIFENLINVMKFPQISTLISANFLFMFGFSMMHGTFILFTAMEIENGGLGFSEMQNGWIFAFIGVIGVIIQGGLIGKLTDRFSMKNLMIFGTLLCGLGIASLPYVPASASWIVFFSSAALAIGNALFSPTQSSLLTFATNNSGHELGAVMGAQEGYSALARIIGPLLAAYIWSETVEGIGLWTYHTCFRVAGIIFILALILQLKIGVSSQLKGSR